MISMLGHVHSLEGALDIMPSLAYHHDQRFHEIMISNIFSRASRT